MRNPVRLTLSLNDAQLPAGMATAMMRAQSLHVVDGGAPEWIHLLPVGDNGVIDTRDDRGPYRVMNLDAIIAASFSIDDSLPIDQDHATDLAAPEGRAAPARGWIKQMEARTDGIWGRVEWTAEGAALVTSRAYRGISPVFVHEPGTKEVFAILRASLVNTPNLRGLTALHAKKESGMDFRDKLIEMLGLDAAASDGDIMKALRAKMKGGGSDAAMQSAMGEVATALGLKATAKPAEIVTAAQSVAKSDDQTVAALQSSNAALSETVRELSATVTALQSGQEDSAAESFFKGALDERRAGVNAASRDHWISMHKRDATQTEALMATLPKLGRSGTTLEPPAPKEGEVALNADQKLIAGQLGLIPEVYAKSLQSQQEVR